MDVIGAGEELIERVRAVAAPLLARGGGRVIERIGSSHILVEFGDAASAVATAVGIRNVVETHNNEIPPEDRIRLRVGVHLGVVDDDGEGPRGETVETAARLRLLVQGGGVFLSKAVCDAVNGRVRFPFDSLGAKKLQNVSQPVESFVVRGTTFVAQENSADSPDVDVPDSKEDEDEFEERKRAQQREDIRAALAPAHIEFTEKPLEVKLAPPTAKSPVYTQTGLKPEITKSTSPMAYLAIAAALFIVGAFGVMMSKQKSATLTKALQKTTAAVVGSVRKGSDVVESFRKAANGDDWPDKSKLQKKLVEQTARIDSSVGEAGGAAVAIPQAAAVKGAEPADSGAEAAPSAQVEQLLLSKCTSDPVSCRDSARSYASRGAFEAAARFYVAACEANDSVSCTSGAELYRSGQGVERSDARATELDRKGCELGSNQSCVAYGEGQLVARGLAGAKDAVVAFEKACNSNSALGCRRLGQAYAKGNGVEQAPDRARELLSKSCTLGDSAACSEKNLVQ